MKLVTDARLPSRVRHVTYHVTIEDVPLAKSDLLRRNVAAISMSTSPALQDSCIQL